MKRFNLKKLLFTHKISNFSRAYLATRVVIQYKGCYRAQGAKDPHAPSLSSLSSDFNTKTAIIAMSETTPTTTQTPERYVES